MKQLVPFLMLGVMAVSAKAQQVKSAFKTNIFDTITVIQGDHRVPAFKVVSEQMDDYSDKKAVKKYQSTTDANLTAEVWSEATTNQNGKISVTGDTKETLVYGSPATHAQYKLGHTARYHLFDMREGGTFQAANESLDEVKVAWADLVRKAVNKPDEVKTIVFDKFKP